MVNRPLVFGSLLGVMIFALTVAGCERQDDPAPLERAPAAKAPARASAVASAPAAETGPAISGADRVKITGRQDSGEFF